MRNFTKIEHIEEYGKRYAIRNGRRFEIGFYPDDVLAKSKRKDFKPEFVKVPVDWMKALEGTSGNTYRLALAILLEGFQRNRMGGEIVLSSETTRMSSATRHRAAMKMEKLGLIKLSRKGNHALRVILI